MRMRLMFCAALILSGCAQTDGTPSGTQTVSDFVYDERDAIPHDVPLPIPGINQRPMLGSLKVLVTVVNYSDTLPQHRLDPAKIRLQTISEDQDSLSTYISVVSKSKLTLNGTLITAEFGPMPDICRTTSLPLSLAKSEGDKAARAQGVNPALSLPLAKSEGDKAAIAQGINPADYDYKIYMIPCGGNASAYMPGDYMGVYGQPGSPHVYKHEFGHSLGYNHPETYTKCQLNLDTVGAPNSCSPIAYGDTGDPVGGGAALYPVNNRWYSGWLNDSQIKTVNKTGKYLLARSGSTPSPITPPVLLLINRNSSPRQIALEFRERMMFDMFPPGDNRLTGVWIRFTDMANTLKNYQLDATPQTVSLADPTLQPGKTLRDSDNKINVKFCGYAGAHASLAISLNDEPIPNCN
ncbi:hypothetical protein ABIA48_001798 [Pseudomonas sp. S30_BP2TU TE3576]|uniref:transposase n=1 Tax=Pseudomonas sp. S30_BP2TU TE3576 TaxID=3349329 RepID=UPI003D223A9B